MTGQSGRREELLAELDEAFAGLQTTCRDLPEARKRVVRHHAAQIRAWRQGEEI